MPHLFLTAAAQLHRSRRPVQRPLRCGFCGDTDEVSVEHDPYDEFLGASDEVTICDSCYRERLADV